MPSNLAGLFLNRLDPELWTTTRNSVECGDNSSLYEKPLYSKSNLLTVNLRKQYHKSSWHLHVKFSGQNNYLFLSCLKKFHRSKLSVCYLLNFCKYQGQFAILLGNMMFKYLVEMDSDQLVCVLLSVLGEKIPVFYLGSKIFCSRTQ